MVEELAVNSVEKKLDMQASILVGNYEYYYACGKLKSLIELAVDEETAPLVMKEIVDEAIANSEKFSIKKVFFSKKYKDDDYVILHEKDFEE